MLKRGKDKNKGKDKGRDPKKSTSSIPEGYVQFDSMNPPDPYSGEEIVMNETPRRGSAVAVTPERPSTSGSEQGVEPEARERSNTVDGATEEVREKAKKGSKWRHRPDFMKKILKDKDRLPSSTSSAGDSPQLSSGAEAIQNPSCVEVFSPDIEEEMRAECRAEVEAEDKEEMEARLKHVEGEMHARLKKQFETNLEKEKRKLLVQTQAQIADTKKKCDILLSIKAKDIQEKVAEIGYLKEESAELKAQMKSELQQQKNKLEKQYKADLEAEKQKLDVNHIQTQEKLHLKSDHILKLKSIEIQRLEADLKSKTTELESLEADLKSKNAELKSVKESQLNQHREQQAKRAGGSSNATARDKATNDAGNAYDPYQDPLEVTQVGSLRCPSLSYQMEDFPSQSHGKWIIFRNFEDLNETWCVVREAVLSGELGATGALCGTLRYRPLRHGAGPVTNQRMSVFTQEDDYLQVGMKLVRLETIQHDIKYKTQEASRKGDFAHISGVNHPITCMTIYWNSGDPYASIKPRPGTVLCPPPCQDKYDPEKDIWKINIVKGSDQDPCHGKWVVVSNYRSDSETNIESVWHELKAKIESGELNIIAMECPAPRHHKGVPKIYVSTSQAHMDEVGREIVSEVKHDIHFLFNDDKKKTLYWNDGSISYEDYRKDLLLNQVMRGKLLEERKKVGLLQRDLQTAQEMLENKDEEHKIHVELLKAQYESARLDQEREVVLPLKRELEQLKLQVLPLRRELEQLRSQKFGEGQFAETYRRMGAERNELRQKLEVLENKCGALIDELTNAKDLLIKNNIPFWKTDGQEHRQHPSNIEHEYHDYNVRPYPGHGQQSTYLPTSSESRNYNQSQGFHHLGDNRPEPPPVHGYPSDHEMQQTRMESFLNRPQDNWQVNVGQKQVSKSNYHQDQQGSSDYNLKQFSRQAAEQAYLHPPGQQGVVQQVGGVSSLNPAYNQQQQQQNVLAPVTNANFPPNTPQVYPDQPPAIMPASQPYLDQYAQPLPQPPLSPSLGPTNVQSRDPAPGLSSPRPIQPRQEQQPRPPEHHPPLTNASPQRVRRTIPSGPQENMLMQGLDADISQAATDVRREVTSMECTSGGEEPQSLPRLDSNLICPTCKRQFRIGQIQQFRSHVDNCQG